MFPVELSKSFSSLVPGKNPILALCKVGMVLQNTTILSIFPFSNKEKKYASAR